MPKIFLLRLMLIAIALATLASAQATERLWAKDPEESISLLCLTFQKIWAEWDGCCMSITEDEKKIMRDAVQCNNSLEIFINSQKNYFSEPHGQEKQLLEEMQDLHKIFKKYESTLKLFSDSLADSSAKRLFIILQASCYASCNFLERLERITRKSHSFIPKQLQKCKREILKKLDNICLFFQDLLIKRLAPQHLSLYCEYKIRSLGTGNISEFVSNEKFVLNYFRHQPLYEETHIELVPPESNPCHKSLLRHYASVVQQINGTVKIWWISGYLKRYKETIDQIISFIENYTIMQSFCATPTPDRETESFLAAEVGKIHTFLSEIVHERIKTRRPALIRPYPVVSTTTTKKSEKKRRRACTDIPPLTASSGQQNAYTENLSPRAAPKAPTMPTIPE